MSKIVIAMDTESKNLEVTVDDKKIPGVTEAYAYQLYDDKGKVDSVYLNVTTREVDGDVRKITNYLASACKNITVVCKPICENLATTLASLMRQK